MNDIINQLQKQINELQEKLNNLKNEPNIEIKTYKAKKGFVFKRNRDGFIVGDEISIGYDYSTGRKRKDKIEFYTEVLEEEE